MRVLPSTTGRAEVAQLVEHSTENAGVPSSTLGLGTICVSVAAFGRSSRPPLPHQKRLGYRDPVLVPSASTGKTGKKSAWYLAIEFWYFPPVDMVRQTPTPAREAESEAGHPAAPRAAAVLAARDAVCRHRPPRERALRRARPDGHDPRPAGLFDRRARPRSDQARQRGARERARLLRSDPATIESVARGELGLMRPGEILVTIKDVK